MMKSFLANSQMSMQICTIVTSLFMLLFGLLGQFENYSWQFTLSYIFHFFAALILLILRSRGNLNEPASNYYILVMFAAGQVLEVELLTQLSVPHEFAWFLALRFFATLLVIRLQWLKLLALLTLLPYLFIRLGLYASLFGYMGILQLHVVFVAAYQQRDQQSLLALFSQTLQSPLIVVSYRTSLPIYHTKALEQEFKYIESQTKEFLDCLLQFENEKKQKIQEAIDNGRRYHGPKTSLQNCQFHILLYEFFENCQFSDSHLLPRRTHILDYDLDEVNEPKPIHIDSPKDQPLKPSINLSDDTPKQRLPKKYAYSQFRESMNESLNKNSLRLKQLDIALTVCIWNGELCYVLQLKDKFQEQQNKAQLDQIEELTQSLTNKDLILASVFHDFKTPINGIVGLLETIERRKEISPQIRYYHQIIQKNVYLMLYMIHDILDYARDQRNQLRLCLSEFYINEIIDEVIELQAIQAEQKGIEIFTNYDIPTCQMYSDPNRIKQILMNLLSNSIKFTDNGSITISVESPYAADKSQHIIKAGSSKNLKQTQHSSTKQSFTQLRRQLSGKSVKVSSARNIYRISIADTGCGIAENIKPRLFNMFATFSSRDTNNNKSGTGLGLMVCKKLVKLLGPSEKVEMESIEGKGTTMSFKLYARMQEDIRNSPNYICVFKQEESSQHFQDKDHNSDEQFKIVRTNQMRVFPKSMDQEFEIKEEDFDYSKDKNIENLKRMAKQFSNNRLHSDSKDDSEDLLDPRIRIVNLIKNDTFGILVVDDQPFNAMAFKCLIEEVVPQLDIIEAYNGNQAIMKLVNLQKSKRIKYVFMDLNMPILNGWQAAKKILTMVQNKELEPVMLIALTGFDEFQEQERCQELGFHAFINKPITLQHIAEIFFQLHRSV